MHATVLLKTAREHTHMQGTPIWTLFHSVPQLFTATRKFLALAVAERTAGWSGVIDVSWGVQMTQVVQFGFCGRPDFTYTACFTECQSKATRGINVISAADNTFHRIYPIWMTTMMMMISCERMYVTHHHHGWRLLVEWSVFALTITIKTVASEKTLILHTYEG